MHNSIIAKFEEDILKAYQSLYGLIEKRNENVGIALNKSFSPIIKDILNSYYYEDNVKTEFIKSESYKSKYISLKVKGFMTVIPFDSLIYYAKNTSEKELEDFSIEFKKEDLLEELKKIDPLYKKIFEKDPLKQKIYMLNKKTIEFTVIETKSESYQEIFGGFQKCWNYEVNFSDDNAKLKESLENNLMDNLKVFDNMLYLNMNKGKKIFIIAHNEDQIAGISMMTPYRDFNISGKNPFFMENRIFYHSYVMVGDQFKGIGLSKKLMDETYKHIGQENKILIRSHPTSMGRERIFYPSNKLAAESNAFIVSYYSEDQFKKLENRIKKDIKKETDYENFIKVYKSTFKDINSVNEHYEMLKNLIPDDFLEQAKLEIKQKEETSELLDISSEKFNKTKKRGLKNV